MLKTSPFCNEHRIQNVQTKQILPNILDPKEPNKTTLDVKILTKQVIEAIVGQQIVALVRCITVNQN